MNTLRRAQRRGAQCVERAGGRSVRPVATRWPRPNGLRGLAAASAALVVAGLVLTATPSGASGTVTATHTKLVATTPPGTKTVSSVVWAVYRTVDSLDPIFTFDYPENTAVSLMCESLLRQAPTGAIKPGLATLATPNPTTLVFTIRPGAAFWDGQPVTAADVVYSLGRMMSTSLGGFFTAVFNRVTSVTATGPKTVTIKLKEPDYWLQDELAALPGVIIEKAYAEKEGKNYGTPAGGIMCTGAYEFKSWSPGTGVVAVANPHYWQSGVTPLVKKITIKGEPTTSTFTSAMLAGNIQGAYSFALSTLPQLEASKNLKVYQGLDEQTDALVISTNKGPLANLKVREALSLALNRKGIVRTVYRGAALIPRWFSSPGTFGYAKSVFEQAYKKAPELTPNLAKARKLIQEAGATGKTVTFGMSNQLSNISAVAGAYKAAGQAIGLNVNYTAVSAQNYINFFTTAKARAGVTGFFTVNYGTYAGPTALLSTFELPGGSQNYDTFNTSAITSLLNQARSTANPTARARLIVKVEKLTMKVLPWIPDVQPTSLLILNHDLTGAVASFSYMYAPWANQLGGKG
jgi:peptide/nickel transport system substrate-binding protein